MTPTPASGAIRMALSEAIEFRIQCKGSDGILAVSTIVGGHPDNVVFGA